MIVENPDEFKAWLTAILEPLCDADPEALAKYVYALVKKDKPTDELRRCMVAQLEVFLQKETKHFVDLLFSKLKLKDDDYIYYIKIKEEPLDADEAGVNDPAQSTVAILTPIDVSTNNNVEALRPSCAAQPTVTEPISETEPEARAEVPPDVKPVVTVQPSKDQEVQVSVESPRLRNGSFGSTTTLNKPVERRLSSSRSHDRKSDSEREDKTCTVRRRGSSGSPPSRRLERSRSRSWERRGATRRSRSKSRRSRSRGRERERSRVWRNRSPPFRNRCYDRDRKMRSWSKSPPPRSRSRSPTFKTRPRYRNRSPLGRSRSRSHSPFDSPRKSPVSEGAAPTQDSNYADDLRFSLTNQNFQNAANVKEQHSRKRRCRDFDEKGFCMRGEMCPYDHGNDPVVLEDVGQVLSFSTPGVQGIPPPVPVEPSTPALGMPLIQPTLSPGLALHHRPQLMNRPPLNLSEYNPDAPSMEPRIWSEQPFRMAGRGLPRGGGLMRPQLGFTPHHQRELISVPVEGEAGSYSSLGNPMKRQCPPEFSNDLEGMSPLKQRFDYSRLGSRRGNCSLQLKKIPSGLNNIAHLHNHFVKFGKIVNIQVCFEGDPEAALITFTTHAEASAAYKSTEAVLNNRFIKVFWYNPDKDNKQENMSPISRTSAKERLGLPPMNTVMKVTPASSKQETNNEMEKVFISGTNITKTVYIPSALEKKLPLSLDKKMLITTSYANSQDILLARDSIKKKQEEKRKEALKLTQHLCKRKHELLEKLLFHQKHLIEKLEKGNFSAEQRAEFLSAIKGFQDNIDIIRKDIKTVVAKPPQNTVKVSPQLVKRTREEVGGLPAHQSSSLTANTQKQILDAELDLFNQQQEGKDTTELQRRVLELKTKAHNLGLLANNGVIRLSRGGTRLRTGRGRGGFNPHATVDHRPTKLLVSGFESDDKADVLQHFSKFGEVVEHIWDEATPALVIQFKTRKEAETAMAKGRNFQDRLMSVTWFNSAQNMGMRNAGMRSVILLNENVADLLSEHGDEEEALRINLEANEDFLLQDEEEEEDEERSWRR